MNIWKPKFYVDWQEKRAVEAARKLVEQIHRLGGFTADDLESARNTAHEEGVVQGSEETNAVANAKLAEVVQAVSAVLELNDLNSRNLIAKVRAHMRKAEKIRKQKANLAEQKRREMQALLDDSRLAQNAAADTSHVLEVLAGVSLTSDNDFALPE